MQCSWRTLPLKFEHGFRPIAARACASFYTVLNIPDSRLADDLKLNHLEPSESDASIYVLSRPHDLGLLYVHIYRLLALLGLLMPLLTPAQGPYDVGATTFVLPLNPHIPVGSSRLRNARGELEPALVAEEITFTAFYPTAASSRTTHKKGLNWLARCAYRVLYRCQSAHTGSDR